MPDERRRRDAAPMTLVEQLERDHSRVEAMLGRLDQLDDAALEEYFCELREALVRHEVAEELVLYPAFREHVPIADAVADARIAEQSVAEQMLTAIEKQSAPTAAMRTDLGELRAAVLKHARAEESEVFPLMLEHVDRETLLLLGERYEKALGSAPTHPHPHAPDTPPANRLFGGALALADRLRDAMRRSAA